MHHCFQNLAFRQHRRRAIGAAGLAAWLLLCVGCLVGPDHQTPFSPTPPEWSEVGVQRQTDVDLRRWWREFRDPVLDHLVQMTLSENLELREAFWRISQARADRGVATGQLFPEVNGTADFATRRVSSSGNPFVVSGGSSTGFDFYSLGFDTVWELDFWGRYRRSVESAQGEVDRTRFDRDAIQVSLVAEVAANYVQLRVFQQRIAYAEESVAIQQHTLQLAESRYRAGLTRKLDVAQAKANLHQTRAAIPRLRAGVRTAWNRLCMLQGQSPRLLDLPYQDWIATPQQPLYLGIPADLLRRRPDVRAAERAVAVQSAQIGVAWAELYPQFTLRGNIGVDSRAVPQLFTSSSLAYQFGPAVRWNILNAGRVRNQIRSQQARWKQAVVQYEIAVLTGLEEVETALAAYTNETSRTAELLSAVESATETIRLARADYEQGLAGFQRVLDAQRTLQTLQDELAQSKGNIALHRIQIYKALGGGWSS